MGRDIQGLGDVEERIQGDTRLDIRRFDVAEEGGTQADLLGQLLLGKAPQFPIVCDLQTQLKVFVGVDCFHRDHLWNYGTQS